MVDLDPAATTAADRYTGSPLAAYGHLLRSRWRSQASYRTSFLMDLASSVWATVFDVLAVLVMFRVTRDIGGFAQREVLVMAGLVAASFATADVVAGSIEQLRHYVRTGLLDAVLVRPLGALPQLLTMELPLRKLSRVVFGWSVLVAALALAGIDWTPARVVLAVVAPVSGAVFFGAVFVASATVAFWWIESGEIANGVTYGGREFTSYPVTVYGTLLRCLFGYGLGFAFVAYQPALALLGRPDPLGLPGWLGWCAPLVSLAAAGAAGAAWRRGLRRYGSTGS